MRRSLLGASMRPVRPARTLGSVRKHARAGDRADRESKRPGRLAWPLPPNTRHVGAGPQVAEIAAKGPPELARHRWLLPAARSHLELGAKRRFGQSASPEPC